MTDELRARGPISIGEAIRGAGLDPEFARVRAADARAAEGRAMAWQGLGVIAAVAAVAVLATAPAVVIWLYGVMF